MNVYIMYMYNMSAIQYVGTKKSIRVHLAAGSKVVKIFTHLRVIIGIT